MADMEVELNELCLLRVFSYISTRKLKTLTTVCKRWNKLIKWILKKRKKDYFIELYTGGDKWVNYENEKMTIKKEDFINEYQSFLRRYQFSLVNKPFILIHFMTPDFAYGSQSMITNNGSVEQETVMPVIRLRNMFIKNIQILSSLLSNGVNPLYVTGDSILANDLKEYTGNTTQKNWANNRGESYRPVKPAITSLLLENGDSYRFETKQLINQAYQLADIRTEADLKRYFGVGDDESIRFILILISEFYQNDKNIIKSFEKNLKQIRKSTNDDLVIAGYYIKEVASGKEQTNLTRIDSEITFVCLISKKHSLEKVKIAQMMIQGPNDNEDPDYKYHPDSPDYPENYHLKQKLKLMKQTRCDENPGENKIFAIVSRSLRRENERVDDNLVLFRQEFPKIPIVGIKSKDKVGHDHYPNVARVNPTKQNQLSYDLNHYGFNFMDSSIYTLISIED